MASEKVQQQELVNTNINQASFNRNVLTNYSFPTNVPTPLNSCDNEHVFAIFAANSNDGASFGTNYDKLRLLNGEKEPYLQIQQQKQIETDVQVDSTSLSHITSSSDSCFIPSPTRNLISSVPWYSTKLNDEYNNIHAAAATAFNLQTHHTSQQLINPTAAVLRHISTCSLIIEDNQFRKGKPLKYHTKLF